MKKKLPYIFLFVLLLIAVLAAGIKYGVYVEKNNKALDYIVKNLPKPSPSVTPEPFVYKTYVQQGCGVQIGYTNDFEEVKVDKPSPDAGVLAYSHPQTTPSDVPISFECAKAGALQQQLESTTSGRIDKTIQFKNQNLKAKYDKEGKNYVFKLYNVNNGKTIYFQVREEVLPMLENTLELTK